MIITNFNELNIVLVLFLRRLMDCIDEGLHLLRVHVRINAVTKISNVTPSTKALHALS